VPEDIPLRDFWSVPFCSNLAHSMIQTDERFQCVSSQEEGLQVNAEGSVALWFGPEAPEGRGDHWNRTVTGRGRDTLLRLFGPLEPRHDQNRRPEEIELVQRGRDE